MLNKFPVIYELKPIGIGGANEATSVHWYCSKKCREKGNPVDGEHAIRHPGAFSYGFDDPNVDGLICESCLSPLKQDAVGGTIERFEADSAKACNWLLGVCLILFVLCGALAITALAERSMIHDLEHGLKTCSWLLDQQEGAKL